MTAPGGSPIQGLISTILTIKQLQNQDAARALAEKQFGLAQASTQEQLAGGYRTLAGSLPDPKVLLPHIPELAKSSGLPEDLLTTLFSSTPPDVAATRNAAVARGATAAGTTLDQPAATTALTGATPGALSSDALQGLMTTGATDFFQKLPPEQRQGFNAGIVQKLATGQTLGEALTDQIFTHMTPEEQADAVKIGKGLAPSANDVIQGRLGVGHLKLAESQAAAEAAARDFQLQIAKAEADSKLTGAEHERAINLLKAISEQQQFMARNSGTYTPEGQVQQNASLNGLYAELRKLDPELGKIFIDIPNELDANGKPKAGSTITATNAFGAFMQKLNQKP